MYFVSMYENRRTKTVEIVLWRREGGGGRMMEGVNLTKIYYKHICKYHHVSPPVHNILIKITTKEKKEEHQRKAVRLEGCSRCIFTVHLDLCNSLPPQFIWCQFICHHHGLVRPTLLHICKELIETSDSLQLLWGTCYFSYLMTSKSYINIHLF
jgi:hypothetical protein